MYRQNVEKLTNWGNFPATSAEIAFPETESDALAYSSACNRLIARGNGKCYGDAALSGNVLSTLRLNKILEFDPQSGIIRCEAGVLLKEVIDLALPQGWFLHVTPGIKMITVGGAIASDVHGKNHPSKGCFSNWLLSFDLLCADGTVRTCSRTQNADLFWQSCGGMGWTGVVLRASFQLMQVRSVYMRQMAVRAENLEAVFHAYAEHLNWSYAAGWVDCLSSGAAFGRGVVYFAEHKDSADEAPLRFPALKTKNVPFFAPSWILNPISIRIHNAMLFSGARHGETEVDMDRYFYPLDRVENWNRLYGRRGFVQYQFCLPEAGAFDGIQRILEALRKRPDTPFLTVLKRHGARPAEAIHSFPEQGYSLALDFPRTRSIQATVDMLDELVWQFGGKIYLTKDACSAPRMGRIDPNSFGNTKFSSLLRERISGQ